jgi:hypothetical protein
MKKRLLIMLCACVILDWYTKKNMFPPPSAKQTQVQMHNKQRSPALIIKKT